MRISEIYKSRQGEGRLTGTPSIFIRTSGCNLRCTFCDTPFTSWNPEGDAMSVQEILDAADALAEEHIVITGGEPMLPNEMVELTDKLSQKGFHITIETAGTIFKDVVCDLMSISPKLSNSTPSVDRAGEWHHRHERNRISLTTLEQLISRYDFQLKFVVEKIQDVDEIKSLCQSLGIRQLGKVLLMPEGVDSKTLKSRENWLKRICEENQFTFCPRMHIEWYGNKRGT